MMITTLRDPDEVRKPSGVLFDEIPDVKVNKQNLEMAETPNSEDARPVRSVRCSRTAIGTGTCRSWSRPR